MAELLGEQMIALDVLVPDDENPRDHDANPENLAAVRASLEDHGQVEPIVVQANTHLIIAGNGRHRVMGELGWEEARCWVLDCTDEEARQLSIRLNRSAELAGWNEATLAKHLADLAERLSPSAIMDLGFDRDKLRALVQKYEPARERLVQFLARDGGKPTPSAPKPRPLPGTARLLQGDCLKLMADLPEESIDAIVTDPPYELGFMGRDWDKSGVAFDPATWAACLRVAKPGAHLIAFGGTRTMHRIACAIEDAGWEIRDTIHWCQWSGFPKSLDISKAIDKVDGTAMTHEAALRVTAWFRQTGITAKQVNEATGTHMASHYLTAKSQPAIPTPEHMDAMRPFLPEVPDWVEALVEARRIGSENFAARPEVGRVTGKDTKKGDLFAPGSGNYVQGEYAITEAYTDEAKRWQGWGTCLKPAVEPAILARKPITGSVSGTVLKYGTGGLHIDACRFSLGDSMWPGSDSGEGWGTRNNQVASGEGSGSGSGIYGRREAVTGAEHRLGRFPANLVHVPKASRAERELGCEGLPTTHEHGDFGDGIGNTPKVGGLRPTAVANHHPTVKPVRLMRWLVRLVTQPSGTVLDPFMGSGTTGMAVVAEGFEFIGCELQPEYVAIARARIAYAAEHQAELDALDDDTDEGEE